MMKLNKKGVDMPQALLVMILVLIIFLAIGAFGTTIASTLKKGSDIEKCRLSVVTQANSKTFTGQSKFSLKCPRRQLNFYEDKVEVNEEFVDKYDFKNLDDEIVNRVIAEELRLCWYKMGEGKLNVFKQNFLDSENVCVICSEINFDDKVKQKEFYGLMKYLQNNEIPKSNTKYYNYLFDNLNDMYLDIPGMGLIPWSNYALSNGLLDYFFGLATYANSSLVFASFEEGSSAKESFDKSKDYVIYFLGFKPGRFSEITYQYDTAYWIGLGTPDKLEKECGRLQN